jgi:hypothetical protein
MLDGNTAALHQHQHQHDRNALATEIFTTRVALGEIDEHDDDAAYDAACEARDSHAYFLAFAMTWDARVIEEIAQATTVRWDAAARAATMTAEEALHCTLDNRTSPYMRRLLAQEFD